MTFRGLVEALRPGAYRLRVAFFDASGQIGPDGVYWDVGVPAPPQPAPTAGAYISTAAAIE